VNKVLLLLDGVLGVEGTSGKERENKAGTKRRVNPRRQSKTAGGLITLYLNPTPVLGFFYT
jgi:hypothetical protein